MTVRELLRGSRGLLGTLSIVPAPDMVEVVALAGFDLVVLDTQHGAYGSETLPGLVLAARSRSLPALVRVRSGDPTHIGAALDAGADGVVVPQIASAAETRAAVAAARFAPEGNRGANPYVRAADFGADDAFFVRANERCAVIVMVEGRAALDDLQGILATPGLDGVFIGPIDLSHALGVPGEIEHPLVLAAVDDVIAAGQAADVTVAVFAPSAERAAQWHARGVGLVVLGVDAALALAGMRQIVTAARGGAE